eukprot:CAMPEP_0176354684 /NCGR_PEP_ID=MMETSP0126-20121128/12743_1 /TAXON_ID=141414 ORGANISM="Strombidinopsis acuminatum, Strain SPMC142" /NCGR_SAMPLE_ID=MMETSP0126 /ASSEMBLY_ACC=CAM_ASM_000229 /LENGTH=92 /DNA_ID=CAMNT_0017706985 /DNA_START=3429 /DNA_END=3707 /DNA_ORIENTATION=-
MSTEREILIKLYQNNNIAYGDMVELIDHFHFESNKTEFKSKHEYQHIVNNKTSRAYSQYEVYISQMMVDAYEPVQEFINIRSDIIIDAISDD